MICKSCHHELKFESRGTNLWWVRCSNHDCGRGFYAKYKQVGLNYVFTRINVTQSKPKRVGSYVDPYEGWNEGFGTWVKSKQHHQQLMKERGFKQ